MSEPDVIGRMDDWDPLMCSSEPGRHWTTSNLGEVAPGVQTPLSWSLWDPACQRAPREIAFAMGAISRAERDLTGPPQERITKVFYGRVAIQAEFFALMGDRVPGSSGREVVTGIFGRVPEGMEFHPTRRRYPVVACRLPATFLGAPAMLRGLARAYETWWAAAVAAVPELDVRDAVAQLAEARKKLEQGVVAQGVGVVAGVQPLHDALGRLVERTGAGDASVLSGVPGGVEMDVVGDIWSASRGRIELGEIVRRHGFHGPLEGEASSRVWREDDAPLRRMVEQYAQRSDAEDPARREAQREREREAVERELLEAVSALQRPAVRLLFKLARERIPLRGVAKRAFVQAMDVARAAARQVGHHLATAGRLADPDDVFYLTFDELSGSLPPDAKDLVERRRRRRDAYKRLTIPGDWTGMPEATPIEQEDGAGEWDLRGGDASEPVSGIGVSGGVVEGVARVVTDPAFADVEPDEILVASTTDPSWASIMFVSSGLVVDIGGALSHAAVVARELGLPCVVNTRTGTRALRTGDRVRVDGGDGTVEILERAAQ